MMYLKRPRFLDPKSDVVFKKIFGQHPDLMKSFLNGILPLPEGHLIKSLTYLTPEQSPRIPSMKNTIVDVKCIDESDRIFIVEMQMIWSKSFVKRFLFGSAKAYVQQLEKGQYYDRLCPVYGLALVNEIFEENMEEWFHHYRLTHTQDKDKNLEGLELIFLEIPKFTPKTFEHKKVGALWLRFLKEIEDLETIPEEFQNNPEIVKAMALSQESAYTAEELEVYDQYLDAVRVEGTIRSDSEQAGEQRGLAKGKELGIAEGEKKEAQKIALKMLAAGLAIEEVSRITGIPVEILGTLKN